MANEKMDLIDREALVANFRRTKMDEIFPNWKELGCLTKTALIRLTTKYRAIILSVPTVKAVVVPCRVGDTLYVISQMRDKRILPFINEYECTSIKLGKRKCCVYHEMDGFIKIFKEDDFGKTVFLTKEEAEAALAKMDGGNEDV